MEIDPISQFLPLFGGKNRTECRRSQEHWLNRMLKCWRLERGLLVPQFRTAAVRILCPKPSSTWQKENTVKNIAGASQGIRMNSLTKRQPVYSLEYISYQDSLGTDWTGSLMIHASEACHATCPRKGAWGWKCEEGWPWNAFLASAASWGLWEKSQISHK